MENNHENIAAENRENARKKRNRRRKAKRILRPIAIYAISIGLCAVIVWAGVQFALNEFVRPVDVNDATPITVTVEKGSGASTIAKVLYEAGGEGNPGLINSKAAFKIYVDGSLNSEVRDVDSKYTTRKNISISESGGKKQITIILQNQGNGKEAELGRYEFSFDDQRTRAQISENITEAFKQVDGIKTAVQTTQAPVVTQAPPPETTPAPPVETTPAPTEPPAVTEPEQIPAETSGE